MWKTFRRYTKTYNLYKKAAEQGNAVVQYSLDGRKSKLDEQKKKEIKALLRGDASITISEIAKGHGVSRAAFYRNIDMT